jgi:hypothetical protein
VDNLIKREKEMAAGKTGILLNAEERAVCERISEADDTPYNYRAQTLLALDEGLSQAQAGERSGLTRGQVKYALSQFRKHKLGIFPEHLQTPVTATPAEPKPQPVIPPEPEPAEDVTAAAQPAQTAETENKKAKKVKDKKKGKKKKTAKKDKPKKDKKKKKKK